jgi:hypothetical protein
MKKLILGLCLAFGILAFSAPSFVNTKQIERKNYNIALDEDAALVYYGKLGKNKDVIVTYFYDGISGKTVSKLLEREIIDKLGVKLQGNFENSRYYISKYYDSSERKYIYHIVGKKSKTEDCYISIAYLTPENLNDKQMVKDANTLLNEAESNLRG